MPLLLLWALYAIGCGNDSAPAIGSSAELIDEEGARADYRMILAGAISDTLRGRAVFGPVIAAPSRTEQLVIKFETGVDFVGGLFITRGSTDLPPRGSHPLADATAEPDSLPTGAFFVVYREGLLRNLRSRSGTVTFDTVSDSLITGSLEATLAGLVATRMGLRSGEVHVSGQFSARSGIVGFIVGI